MTVAVVAQGIVELIPSARGFSSKLQKEIGGDIGKVGDKQGKSLGGKVAKGFGFAAKAGFAGAGIVAGAALAKGFGRLKGIDEAQGKLKGLGHSTKTVDKIMDNALTSVKGTAFGLDEAATSAAGAVAAGVKPGRELERNLTLVGDAATIAGTDMGSMGSIFNKVASTDMIQGDVLAQLGDQGIPILQFLSKEMGVSAGEVKKLASEGKVDFETFQNAMEEGLGGAGQESGKTFSGAMKNAGAALGRLGASVLSGSFPLLKDGFGDITAMLDKMGPMAEDWGKKLGGAIKVAGEYVGQFISDFKEGEGAAGTLRTVLEGAGKALVGIGKGIAETAGFFSRHTTTAKIFAGILMAAVVPALAVSTAAWIAMKIEAVKAGLKSYWAAVKTVAGWVMMGVQATLGALKVAAAWLIAIGPIALVIAAVIGIGILIYKNWDSIKKWTKIAWDAIVGFVVAAWDKIVGAVKGAWDKVVGWSQAAWGKIKDIAGKLAPLFSRAKDGIVNAFKRLYKILTFPFRAAYVFWDITVHALIYIFKKVRDKVKSVWDKVRAIVEKPIRKAVDWVRRYIDNMRRGFRIIRDKIKELWDKARGIVEKPIRKAVDWVVKKVMQIRDRFMHLRNRVRILWNKAQEIVQRPIRRAVVWVLKKIMDIRDKFQVLRNRVKSIWDKVQGIVKRPIRLAVDWAKRKADQLSQKFTDVRDKIGRGWRKLQSLLKKPIIGAIKWINDKFLGPVGGKKGINGMLAKIGVGDKYQISNIRGFASGGYTGPGSKMTPAGVVHADEFVVRKKARGRFERDNPGVLDHINRTGRLPGYAIGGKVAGLNKRFLEQLGRFNAAAGNRYHVNSGYRSNAHQARLYALYLAGRNPLTAPPGRSQHNKGLAADLAPSDARNRHGNLASKFGLAFTVPSESWHIEPAWGRGSNAGPSLIGGLFDTVKDALRGLTDKGKSLLKNVPGSGMIPPMVKGIGSKVVKGAKSWVKPSLESMLSFIPGSGAMKAVFGKIKKGSNQFLGRQMAKNGYGWTGGQWSALNNLWTKESNWNHKARNASSGAYGIPQSLPGSKMASSGSDWRTSASTQIKWGLKYIKERYGSPSAAWAHSKRTNWYADGGRVTPAVFDNGGTLAPGLNLVNNKLGKPEALVRPEQMGSPQVNITFAPGTEWLADFVQTEITYADAFAGAQGRMA